MTTTDTTPRTYHTANTLGWPLTIDDEGHLHAETN